MILACIKYKGTIAFSRYKRGLSYLSQRFISQVSVSYDRKHYQSAHQVAHVFGPPLGSREKRRGLRGGALPSHLSRADRLSPRPEPSHNAMPTPTLSARSPVIIKSNGSS